MGYPTCDVDNFAVLLPLVAVSASECIDVLLLAGFTVRSRTEDATRLEKADRAVVIRSSALLTPDELVSLLRDAGLAYSDFLDLLSEAPTEPSIRRSSLARVASSPPPR